MAPIWVAAKAAITSLVEKIPWAVWKWGAAIAVGACLGGVGVHLWHTGSPAALLGQSVTSGEPKSVSNATVDPWSELRIHRADTTTVVDTSCAVVPESVLQFAERRPQNGLPEVTYDIGALTLPSIKPPIRLPYAVLPLRSGRSPTVGVGPDEVTLHARHPKTGQGLTWRWAVPKPSWTVSAGVGVSAEVFGEKRIGPVQQSVSLEVTRSFGNWSATAIGGVSGRVPTVGVEVRYQLFTVGTR